MTATTTLHPEDLIDSIEVPSEEWDRMSDQAKRILSHLVPEFMEMFIKANAHYGGNNANVLGPAGQFADIWRKIGPLRRSLWEGEELTRESADEICMDLIGHLFLTIDMLRQGVDRRGVGS